MSRRRRLGMFLVLAGAWLALSGALQQQQAQAAPALVMEAQTGLVIYSEDLDQSWHPASLTKMMTVYLAFEAIRDGKLSLEDNLVCSELANAQPPSKIGLPVGAEMPVPLALRALMVRSANDVAVMFAEHISGSVEAFSQKMNDTAKRLGMTRTYFVNPHGLPDERQISTARDMGLLARALLREFPEYGYLYAMSSFQIGKARVRSHNRLLQTFDGADGIKTGFICDSGYNVVASATREGRQLVAVVLGARSGSERNERAAALLAHGFEIYGWKAVFSPSIDNYGYSGDLEAGAPRLRPVVCGRRR
jgi:D-alanyl-D-alanine carboxypeptidase